jgi:hypothetical protein
MFLAKVVLYNASDVCVTGIRELRLECRGVGMVNLDNFHLDLLASGFSSSDAGLLARYCFVV